MIAEEIRRQFDEQTAGWLHTDDFIELSEIIERSADWIRRHGGVELLDERQRATVRMMIERQALLGLHVLAVTRDYR